MKKILNKLGLATKTDVEKAYHKGFYEGIVKVSGPLKRTNKMPKIG